MNLVDRVVLEGALGKAFSAFDMTDWGSRLLLFRPIGFGVLLRSSLLKATAGVCLRFSQQAQLLKWEGLGCGPNLRRVFETVFGRSMMQM